MTGAAWVFMGTVFVVIAVAAYVSLNKILKSNR